MLPLLMIVSLGLGIALTASTSDTPDPSPVEKALAVVAFACFVSLFSIYWLGWLLRGHELWRKQTTDNDNEYR